MSLLQSLFGQRFEERQHGMKPDDPRCGKAFSAMVQQKRRPAGACDLDLSLQEKCDSMEKMTFSSSPESKLPTPGSSKGRAEVLANFNQRYEIYDRLLR
eukprot:Skav212083  [mRNA]  locus=scaffold867:198296:201069:- [translate_table: standard]